MPCLTMRKVIGAIWPDDFEEYKGRQITIYRDPTVKFGPDETGGVRISHMSGIDKTVSLAVLEKRGKRKKLTIFPLEVPSSPPKPTTTRDPIIDRAEMQRQADAAKEMSPEEKKEWWGKLNEAEKAVVRELAAKKEAGDE